MNNSEIKKYIREKIGAGISKLEVLKTLFENHQTKAKRKYIKQEVNNMPTPELEDNTSYKVMKGIILTFLIIVFLINTAVMISEFSNNSPIWFVYIITLLIVSLEIFYIWQRNSLHAYGWFAFLNFMSIGKLDEALSIAGNDQFVKNMVVIYIIAVLITFILALIIIYKYFANDNKEWKRYIEENKL